jgi:hypothetical protein
VLPAFWQPRDWQPRDWRPGDSRPRDWRLRDWRLCDWRLRDSRLRDSRPRDWRLHDWRLVAAFVLAVATFYAPYIGIGWRVLGFLGGYVHEENLGNGRGIFLLEVLDRVVPLPAWAAAVYAAAVLAILAALGARFAFATSLPADPGARAVAQARHAAILGAVVLAALSPQYPWYFAWLAPLVCLTSLASVCWLLVTAPLLVFGPREHLLIPAAVYGPAAVLAVLDYRRLQPRSA